MEEFERVGAEALLLPLSPPEEVLVGGEQECHLTTLVSDCAARSIAFQTMRRQSGAEGGFVGTATPTPSLEWWCQPWGHCWARLAFYWVGCQQGLGSC